MTTPEIAESRRIHEGSILTVPTAMHRTATRVRVVGVPIAATTWDAAIDLLSDWGPERVSRVICICSAHSVVTAARDSDFGRVVASADLATPDGAPVAWMMRRLGAHGQRRIDGSGVMWRACARATEIGQPIYLYGSAPETLDALVARLAATFPALRIVGAESPPFRLLTADEDADVVARINDSGAQLVFVSLGCPAQEYWMDSHRDRVHAVMVGVGAAFDYHAGTLRRAPAWMQRYGLEWAFRFRMEPGRLWKRYLVTNTLFIALAARQLCARWVGGWIARTRVAP
jgi:N-acetylglucosaminyldiphosphoundecaprenol N-acetyl-beta-D-mannosaminyltransferase